MPVFHFWCCSITVILSSRRVVKNCLLYVDSNGECCLFLVSKVKRRDEVLYISKHSNGLSGFVTSRVPYMYRVDGGEWGKGERILQHATCGGGRANPFGTLGGSAGVRSMPFEHAGIVQTCQDIHQRDSS